MNELEALDAACRTSFDVFAMRMFKTVEPGTQYEWGWYLGCIAEHLEAASRNELPRLIINLPPRCLKSYLVARAFPAWRMGKNPSEKFISTSYGYEVTEQNAMACRRIMKSPQYMQMFPETRISAELDRNTHFETTKMGQYYAASALSPLTGMGGEWCFIGKTKVLTQSGYKNIKDIGINESVWSFNHETGQREIRRVTAVFKRDVSGLVQVKTSGGRRIVCTPEHPFWVDGFGYKQAKDLKAMERLVTTGVYEGKGHEVHIAMHLLRKGVYAFKSRLSEILTETAQGFVLLQSMLQTTPQLQEPASVRYMQSKDRIKNEEVLRGLPHQNNKTQGVTGIWEAIQSYCSTYRVQGQIPLCDMSIKEKEIGASHRRGQKEQPARESIAALSKLPHNASSREFDSVASVTPYSGKEHTVYDITVEGNHNFFAEGILVHNCIVDDPLKPMEAYSDTIRNSTNLNIRTTMFSRFNDKRTGKFVLIMQRVHEDDPTGNLLKDGGYYHLRLPAEAKTHILIKLGDREWEMQKGELLSPSRLSREILDQTMLDMTPMNYAGQMLQEPVPIGGGEFFPEWPQHYNAMAIKPKGMNVYILVDAAGGDETNKKKKKTSDRTAMAVIGLAPDNNYYLLDLVIDRFNATERIDMLFILHKKWNEICEKPPKVGYEKYGLMTDTHYAKKRMSEEGYNFQLIELGGRMAKEERIRRMIPDLQKGRWYFPDTLIYTDTEGRSLDMVKELLDSEMAVFPRSRFDDGLDAVTRIYDVEMQALFPMIKKKSVYTANSEQKDSWINW